MMGYIMKKRQTAIGMEMTGAPFTDIARPSSVFATDGASLPSTMPAPMQARTQNVRYFSKTFRPLDFFSMHASVVTGPS